MISNENISDVIDCLTYPILILDQDGTLLVINKVAAALLNQPTTITPGIPIWKTNWWAKPTSVKEKWSKACRSATKGDQLKLVETVFVSGKDETEIIFSLSPRKNREGKITQLFVELHVVESHIVELHESTTTAKAGIPVDKANTLPKINDSEKTREDALLETERKFRLMVESIEDYAMFMVDLEGFITSWNRGAERLTGYSDIEAIGRHFSMLYHPEFQNKDHATYELAMAQANGRHEEEGIRVRKNGTQYHAQIIVWRIEDVAGNTVGYAKITRDITALKEAQLREIQLFESENQFRLMVNSIQDYAMFMVDLNGIITSWNHGAERLTGYSEQEAIGRPFSILYPRNEISDEHAVYELTMAREKGYHEEEGTRVKKKWNFIPCTYCGLASKGQDG